MTYRVKHVLEYGALRAVAGLVGVLPYRLALAVGWGLAWVGFHIVRFRRREAERRIREVFGARLAEPAVRRVAWISLRNLCFTAVEIMRSPSLGRDELERIGDYGALIRALRENHEAGRGAICALPHMGSWELSGRMVTLSGLPAFSVAGKQKNPLFDRYLNRTREAAGMPITMRGASALKAIVSRLKVGGILALLPDVRMPTEGVKVRFLGKEANVGAGMALFARHAGVPVFPIIVTRVGWARHVARVYPPLWADPAADKREDVQRLTQAVLDIVNQAILDQPEQWFWYNRRWVLDPV